MLTHREKKLMYSYNPEVTILRPFSDDIFIDIKNHVKEIRRIFDWPGIPYHDEEVSEEGKFNRWYWNNLPLLAKIHHDPSLIKIASDLAGIPLKPSYCFLSLYGEDGICPLHKDRPSCQFTLDLQVNSDGQWPIYIEDNPYILKNGEAIFYSGTSQEHYRKSMLEDSNCTFMDLVFFSFCSINLAG
jgi:hypothetical protein